MPDKDKPITRARAPTITVDTSNVSNDKQDNEMSSPSKSPGNTNSLAVPQNRARGSSLDSASSAGGSSQTYSETDGDPLAAREGDDEAFEVENNPFAYAPGQMSRLYNPKNIDAFKAMGGLLGL